MQIRTDVAVLVRGLSLVVGAFTLMAGSCSGGDSGSPQDGQAQTADLKLKVNWNPLLDDPNANVDDGKVYPDEAAINNEDASESEKANAWGERAIRMSELRELKKADIATKHADYWDCRKAFKNSCTP